MDVADLPFSFLAPLLPRNQHILVLPTLIFYKKVSIYGWGISSEETVNQLNWSLFHRNNCLIIIIFLQIGTSFLLLGIFDVMVKVKVLHKSFFTK